MSDLQQAATELLDEIADRWKRNDGAAVGELFTEDGSLVNPFGQRADGRSAIAAMYSQFFGGMLGDTTTRFSAIRVRPVGADHAFLDCDQVIEGGGFQLDGHLAALLRNEAGQWRIVDGRPHEYLTPPA